MNENDRGYAQMVGRGHRPGQVTQIDRNRTSHIRAERSWREEDPFDWQADTVVILPVDPTPTPPTPFPAIDAGAQLREPRTRPDRVRPTWAAVGGAAGLSWVLGIVHGQFVGEFLDMVGRWVG